jgi:Uma2 family endonuclease
MMDFSRQDLPSTADLPYSDGRPMDNELQNLLPNLLRFLIMELWGERFDWYFGVKLAIYHTTGADVSVPFVPEAFLSLGVDRRPRKDITRYSYATWENEDIVPVLVLEMVSHIPRGEYDSGMSICAGLGVLYYVVYNPEFWGRDHHQPFEMYKLEDGEYRLQIGEPCWIPEVGLGIGRYQGEVGGLTREILTWYDKRGIRHLGEAEQHRLREEKYRLQADQYQLQAEEYRLQAEQHRLRAEEYRLRE